MEDIHYLMTLSKRPPKPVMLANFHNKLCLVFWKAGNMLFHACSRHKLFRLTRDMKKNPSMDDLARSAFGWVCWLTFNAWTVLRQRIAGDIDFLPENKQIVNHTKSVLLLVRRYVFLCSDISTVDAWCSVKARLRNLCLYADLDI